MTARSVLRRLASRLSPKAQARPAPTPAPRAPVEPPAGPSAEVTRIRSSGLFDEEWYASQLGPGEAPADLVEDYLTTGHLAGRSATPALLESWYRSQLTTTKSRQSPPLLHYLRHAPAPVASPHPLLTLADGQAYLAAHPESAEHPGGPLGHYLARTATDPLPGGLLAPDLFLDRARQAALLLHRTRTPEGIDGPHPAPDPELADAFTRDLLADPDLLTDPPSVSIVLPTLGRPGLLREAIASVLAQSYPAWELLVVDDGSREDVAAVVTEPGDPRIRLLRHPETRGVAAARNTALAAATGDYVAYLDSDTTWTPTFLEVMLRHLERAGAAVGYAVSAHVEQGPRGRARFWGMPFSAPALQAASWIECASVVHERALLAQVGTFDESLLRGSDWDLLVRLAEVTEPTHAPFIGVRSDPWAVTDRLTTTAPAAHLHRVRQRTLLDWAAVRADLEHRADHLSVVVVAQQAGPEDLVPTLERLLEVTPAPLELVLVDDHLTEASSVLLHATFAHRPEVRYLRLPQRLTLEVARNVGLAESTGRTVAVLSELAWVFPGWERPLLDGLDHAVAVQPTVLERSGAVRSAGLSFLGGQAPHHLFAGFSSEAPELRGTREVDALGAAALVAGASDLVAVDGFDPAVAQDPFGPELSLRLRRASGRPVLRVGESQVVLRRDLEPDVAPAALRTALDNADAVAALWHAAQLEPLPVYGPSGLRVQGYRRDPQHLEQLTPVLVRDRPARPLRWAIKIGVLSATRRQSWGDWHFAQALQHSLEALGHQVSIDGQHAWYRPTSDLDDVVLVLQGRGRYRPAPGQLSAVWVISHPAEAPLHDLGVFDLAFGASERWCTEAAAFARRPPELLLQCTDPQRFHPVPPDPDVAHDLLMVGNARGVRPAVRDALAAGLHPHVFGSKWEGLLPPGAWQGEYIPNELLPTYYASAGTLLNDHWDDMRDWGLVSNRLFDAVACGARVVSDDVDGIEELFAGVVPTYRSPAELRAAVETMRTEDARQAERRLQLSRRVREEHSFDARARTLSERVHQVLAEDPARG